MPNIQKFHPKEDKAEATASKSNFKPAKSGHYKARAAFNSSLQPGVAVDLLRCFVSLTTPTRSLSAAAGKSCPSQVGSAASIAVLQFLPSGLELTTTCCSRRASSGMNTPSISHFHHLRTIFWEIQSSQGSVLPVIPLLRFQLADPRAQKSNLSCGSQEHYKQQHEVQQRFDGGITRQLSMMQISP